MKRTTVIVFAGAALVSVVFAQTCLVRDSYADELPGSDNTLREIRVRGKIVVGVPSDEPPFGFVDEKGKLEGISIDIGRALSKEVLGDASKVEFVAVSAETMCDLLKTGRIDILLVPLSVDSEERKKGDGFHRSLPGMRRPRPCESR
jgi:ABC-type amino acid transport substrate-binding protein